MLIRLGSAFFAIANEHAAEHWWVHHKAVRRHRVCSLLRVNVYRIQLMNAVYYIQTSFMWTCSVFFFLYWLNKHIILKLLPLLFESWRYFDLTFNSGLWYRKTIFSRTEVKLEVISISICSSICSYGPKRMCLARADSVYYWKCCCTVS